MYAASPVDSLGEYGVLGTLLGVSYLAIGYLTRWLLTRAADREKRLEEELKEARSQEIDSLEKVLTTTLESTVTLKKSNDVHDKVMDHLLKNHEDMQRLISQLEAIREQLRSMR